MVLRRLSFWLALAGILLAIATLWGARDKPLPPPPLEPPPQNPYPVTVAAAGIIESVNENVRIAPPVSGLVTKVYVKVTDHVKQGDPLFQLDERELRAQLQTKTDSLPSAAARIAEQEIHLRDVRDQLKRLQSVTDIDRGAVSEDDLQRKWHEVEVAKRTLIRARADLQLTRTQRDEVQALLNRLTVRAPRAATILQVNIRAGEYAMVNAIEPLILLGDTETLQVRADIDEVNAPLVVPGSPAVAYLKGYTDKAIPLIFDRIEPYVVPKRSLTGDNRERVDTRVLQVIYRFDKPAFPVYVGQQVDVYIERSDNPIQDQGNGHPDLEIQQPKPSHSLSPEGERRGKEAFSAEALASEMNRRGILLSLVTEVEQPYFRLRELDEQVEIAERNLASQQDSLLVIRTRAQAGLVSDLDVKREETLVAQTASGIPELRRQ